MVLRPASTVFAYPVGKGFLGCRTVVSDASNGWEGIRGWSRSLDIEIWAKHCMFVEDSPCLEAWSFLGCSMMFLCSTIPSNIAFLEASTASNGQVSLSVWLTSLVRLLVMTCKLADSYK